VNFLTSQGSVATYLRYDGKQYMALIVNFIIFPAVKKFENRLRFDEDKAIIIGKSLRGYFFD